VASQHFKLIHNEQGSQEDCVQHRPRRLCATQTRVVEKSKLPASKSQAREPQAKDNKL